MKRAICLLLTAAVLADPQLASAVLPAISVAQSPTVFQSQAIVESSIISRMIEPVKSAQIIETVVARLRGLAIAVAPWRFHIAGGVALIAVVWMADTQAILHHSGAVFARIGLGLGLKLRMNLKQDIKQTIKLRERLQLRMAISLLKHEALSRKLWQVAIKEGRIRTYENPKYGIKFSYAVVNKNGLTPFEKAEYDDIIRTAGHAFAQCVFDPWDAFFEGRRVAMSRGEWFLCVDEGFFKEFEKYAAVHEFGEQITIGNHHLATKLEFAIAADEHQLNAYLQFLQKYYPSKLRNAFSDRQFGSEDDLDPQLLSILEMSSRSEETAAARKLIETFRWPQRVEDLLAAYRPADREVEAMIMAMMPALRAALDQPISKSHTEHVSEAEKIAEHLFQKIRESHLSDRIDVDHLSGFWKERVGELARLFDARVQEYRVASRQNNEYLSFVRSDKSNLDHGIFIRDFEVLIGLKSELAGEALDAAISAVSQGLKAHEKEDRIQALHQAAALDDVRLIQNVRQILFREKEEGIRQIAMSVLGQLASHTDHWERQQIVEMFFGLLSGPLKDPSAAVRNAILVALSQMDISKNEFPAGAIQKAMNDEDLYVRIDAAHVLLKIWGISYVGDLAKKLEANGDAEFNQAILGMLSDPLLYLTEDDLTVIEAVRKFRREEKNRVLKLTASNVLAQIKANTDLAKSTPKKTILIPSSDPASWTVDETFHTEDKPEIGFAMQRIGIPAYLAGRLKTRWWRMEAGRRIYGDPDIRRTYPFYTHLEIASPDEPWARLEFEWNDDSKSFQITFVDLQSGTRWSETGSEGRPKTFSGSMSIDLDVTGRRFLDAIAGIPSEPGERRALAIRDWLLRLDQEGLAVQRDGANNIGVWSGVLRMPRDVSKGRMFLRVLSDKGRHSRFILLLDPLDQNRFVALEMDPSGGLLRDAALTKGEIPGRWREKQKRFDFDPIDLPQVRKFFRELPRALLVYKQKNNTTSYPLRRTAKMSDELGLSRNRPLTILKVEEVTSASPTGTKGNSQRESLGEPLDAEENVSFPILICDPSIENNTTPDTALETQNVLRVPVAFAQNVFIGHQTPEGYGYFKRLPRTEADNHDEIVRYRQLTWHDPLVLVQAQMVGNDYFSVEGVHWAVGPQKGLPVLFQGRLNLAMLVGKYGDSRIITISEKIKAAFMPDEEALMMSRASMVPPTVTWVDEQWIIIPGDKRRIRELRAFEPEIDHELMLLHQENAVTPMAPDPRARALSRAS